MSTYIIKLLFYKTGVLPVCQNCYGPIWFVALFTNKLVAPEVVKKKVSNWSFWKYIFIINDCFAIVKYKVSIVTVAVADNRNGENNDSCECRR